MKLLDKLLSDTPKRGRRLAKIGVGVGLSGVGVHAGAEFFQQDLAELLPENQRLVYILFTKGLEALPYILEGLGIVLAMVGASSTVEPDEKAENGTG